MNAESWNMIKGRILDAFADAEHSFEDLPAPERGQRELIVFRSPVGRMMLERMTGPLLVNTISHGARRVGAGHNVEHVYDESQSVDRVKLYREVDCDWQEVDINALNF